MKCHVKQRLPDGIPCDREATKVDGYNHPVCDKCFEHYNMLANILNKLADLHNHPIRFPLAMRVSNN